MYYAISHLTLYKYSEAINDSVMEIRMQPRSDGNQRNIRFDLNVSPDTQIFSVKDYMGNTIHHFNIPAPHESLAIKAESMWLSCRKCRLYRMLYHRIPGQHMMK